MRNLLTGVLLTGIWAWMPTQAQTAVPTPVAPATPSNAALAEELKAIRQLLEKLVNQQPAPAARPAAPAADAKFKLVALPGDKVLGKPDAPVTLVEFTDLQCPFCRQFRTTSFELIKKEFIDTGKLRFISRDLPLPAIHPLAESAAKASRCAGDQGKFWELRHAILVNNRALTPAIYQTLAQDLGMDIPAFAACIADPKRHAADIAADKEAAAQARFNGTPGFIVGRTLPDGVEGLRIVGAVPYAEFEKRINQALAGK